MTEPDGPDVFGSRSMRLARWWTDRYTAGLPARAATARKAEIESDLADHAHARLVDGWSSRAAASERLRRTVRGAVADVAWRREVITRSRLDVSVQAITGLASVLLGAYFLSFAWFLLGNTSIAGRSLPSAFEGYAEEVGPPLPVAIVATLGLLLIAAAVLRPVSAVVSNAATLTVAPIAVMMFWFGVWPLGLVVCAGAVVDLATRTAASNRQP